MLLFTELNPGLFPFAGAIKHLTEEKFSIGTALRREDIINGAIQNIKDSIDGKIEEGGYYGISYYQYPKTEVNYVMSVILIACSDNIVLAKKFALGEARRAEIMFNVGVEPLLQFTNTREENREYLIPINEYIKRSSVINEKSWKLTNRTVNGGMVYLTKRELIRLFRPDIINHIISTIKTTNVEEKTKRMLNKYVIQLEEIIPKPKPVQVGKNGVPPCVQHGILEMQSGNNLNHSGRFLVASWMISAGYDVDEIENMFVNAPDYKKEVTRYQISNIKKRNYKPQSCEKLQSMHLCHKTEKCNGIINPLSF